MGLEFSDYCLGFSIKGLGLDLQMSYKYFENLA